MPLHNGIVWLASYPKSGNTWFRAFLSRLLQPDSRDNLNQMDTVLGSGMAANRSWLNDVLGLDSSLLNADELEKARAGAAVYFSEHSSQTSFIKVHDAFTRLKDGTPLFPKKATKSALYFIRNPLDVAVSLAHHAQCPLDWSIHMMNQETFTVPLPGFQNKQVPQKLLTWSQHVQSWTEMNEFEVCVLRYEDMLTHPLETFHKAVKFLQIPVSSKQISDAVLASSFKNLQTEEKSKGFKENPHSRTLFFRQGTSGGWKEILKKKQSEKIIRGHAQIMERWGYLTDYFIV